MLFVLLSNKKKIVYITLLYYNINFMYRISFENYVALRKREKIEREANMLYEKYKERETNLSKVEIT